ncbi:MAG: hypothetical protein IJS32_09455 [Kiritimatiellae bacterium]|nr:hypothetical protein [Kiritimatiellia bacterium]
MKKRLFLLSLALLASAVPVFAGDDDKPDTGDISADANYMADKGWYFICIQLTNLTGYPVCIDEVSGSGPSRTYHGAGYVIPMDENNPGYSACYIGWRRNSGLFEGPDMNVKFHLVGREGSSPCTLRVVNHYAFWDGNEISPSRCFPADQCPPMPGGDTSPAVNLYHNVDFMEHGHYLTVVATLAFKDLFGPDRQMPRALQKEAVKTISNSTARARTLTEDDLLGGKMSEDEFLK